MPDPISQFHKDKNERKEYFLKFIYGWKEIPCGACDGSGYYDNTNSPKCGACDGTGKEKVSPQHFKEHMNYMKKHGHKCGKKWISFKKEGCCWCRIRDRE